MPRSTPGWRALRRQSYSRQTHRVYRQRRLHFTKTRPTAVSIGERRRPNPQGQPGYLRVDTVHQGDCDGVKGVDHMNAVDEVTQRLSAPAASSGSSFDEKVLTCPRHDHAFADVSGGWRGAATP